MRSYFNDNISESFYSSRTKDDDNKICSYEIILYIINHHFYDTKKYSINDLKNILIEEYSTHEYCERILTLLYNYNRNKLLKDVINFIKSTEYNKNDLKKMIPDIINNDTYMLTFLDVYILSKKLNIPIIFICNGDINFNSINRKYIVANVNKVDDLYYFIKVPSIFTKGEKSYKLLHYINNYRNKIKLDINNDINDNNELRLKTSLKNEILNFQDIINNIIIGKQ